MSQASKLSASGAVNLTGGTLEADVSGFNLAAGETFTALSFTPGDLTGAFKTLISGQHAADGTSVDLGNGLTLGAVYSNAAGTVQLQVVATPTTTVDNGKGGAPAVSRTAADWDAGVPLFYSDVVIGNTASGAVTVLVRRDHRQTSSSCPATR